MPDDEMHALNLVLNEATLRQTAIDQAERRVIITFLPL